MSAAELLENFIKFISQHRSGYRLCMKVQCNCCMHGFGKLGRTRYRVVYYRNTRERGPKVSNAKALRQSQNVSLHCDTAYFVFLHCLPNAGIFPPVAIIKGRLWTSQTVSLHGNNHEESYTRLVLVWFMYFNQTQTRTMHIGNLIADN